MNAQFAVLFLAWITVCVVLYCHKEGFTLKNVVSSMAGGTVLYLGIAAFFWIIAQLGYYALGYSSTKVTVDDKFADTWSAAVDNSILNSDGMTKPEPAAKPKDASRHDGYSYGPVNDDPAASQPRHASAIDSSAAAVQVIKLTPTPLPTPVKYIQTQKLPVLGWRLWFVSNNFNRGAVDLDKIPIGVRCRVVKTENKSLWVFGQEAWTMRCSDPDNPDYGTTDVNTDIKLTRAAYESLGLKGDDNIVEGTGTWPKGFFVPEGEPQSQAPASPPWPAPAASQAQSPSVASGPEKFASIFSAWLIIDAAPDIPCLKEGKISLLPKGKRYRFNPKTVRNNGPSDIPKVEVLINQQGATCWAELWPGRSHIEQ